MAVWLNLTTALVGSGLPITTPAAIVGQGAILAGAVGTAVAITLVHARPAAIRGYGRLGAGWIVSTVQGGYPVLAATAGLGLAIVLATAVLARRQARA